MKTGIGRVLRTALAGSLLFGGAVIASVVAGSLPASAATTVEYVAIGGSDTGTCQSAASPCASISYAYLQTSAASSSTIDVGPGVFPVALCICGGGGDPYANFVTIQGAASGPAPATTLEGQAIAERGGLTLENLTVNGESGDALFAGYAGTLQVIDSTVTNSNPALYLTGPEAELSITDSTISGNGVAMDLAGGPSTFNSLESTIADNGAGLEAAGVGQVNLADTIVSDNEGHDCALSGLNPSSSVVDDGYNIDDDATCGLTATTSLSDTPAGLDPSGLQNNGGPTQTILPATGSPAIGAIPRGTTLNGAQVCPRTDQRGVTSVGRCTIGAVEVHLCAGGLTPPCLERQLPRWELHRPVLCERPGDRQLPPGHGVGPGRGDDLQRDHLRRGAGQESALGWLDQRHQECVRRGGSGESDRDVHIELTLVRRATRPRL